jgi:hypothetical protein
MREELILDMGGAESLSVAKLALVEIIARDTYFLDESERRIFQLIHKVSVQERALESLKPSHRSRSPLCTAIVEAPLTTSPGNRIITANAGEKAGVEAVID